jgi:hypothetical protein
VVLCHAALGLPPGVVACADLSPVPVHAGMPLDVVPAQRLAQTRPGALGAVFPWHHTTPVGTRTRAGRSG